MLCVFTDLHVETYFIFPIFYGSAKLFSVYSFIGVWCFDLTISDIRWLEAGLIWQPYNNTLCQWCLPLHSLQVCPQNKLFFTQYRKPEIVPVLTESWFLKSMVLEICRLCIIPLLNNSYFQCIYGNIISFGNSFRKR